MKIYRYRAISTNTYDEIVNGEVWYSKFSELNDPFEGFYINESNKEALDHFIGTLGVCCFSRVSDSLLMWAHYGDSHRGLCLEYDVADEDVKTTFMEVDYPASPPTIAAIERYPAGHPSEGSLAIHIDKEGKAFTTKSDHWAYEKELRTFRILTDPTANGEISKSPGTLTAVLFGLRASGRNIVTIDKILADNGDVAFLKANLRKHTYQMEFQPIDRNGI